MKIFYTTDLHGIEWKYEKIKECLTDHELLIIGADILPRKERDCWEFIDCFLCEFFSTIGLPVIIDFGNDDYYMHYDHFLETVNDFKGHVFVSHMKEVVIQNYKFIGMHYVPDYPFGRKDWCRNESSRGRISDPLQIEKSISTLKGRFQWIEDLDNWLLAKDTIAMSLNALRPPEPNHVYLFHSPPRWSLLDHTKSFGAVGSSDILNWIRDNNPLLCLHGHIHESFKHTGKSLSNVNGTVCINPGQIQKTFTYCEFDLTNVEGTYQRKEIERDRD